MATGRIITRPRTPIAAQLRRPWEKPRHPVKLNWSHPHAHDLRFWAPMLPGQDGRQGRDLDITRLSEISAWDDRPDFFGRNRDGDLVHTNFEQQVQFHRSAVVEPQYITVLAKIWMRDHYDTDYDLVTIVSKDILNYASPYFSYNLGINNSPGLRNVRAAFGVAGNARYATTADDSMVYEEDIWIAGAYGGELNGFHVYVFDSNGTLITSAAGGFARSEPITYSTTDLYIGDSYIGDVWLAAFKGMTATSYTKDVRIWGHFKTAQELSGIIKEAYASLVPAFGRDFVYEFERKQRHQLFFGTNF